MNHNINKLTLNGELIFDISDTTASESDVKSGKKFYKANGEVATGTHTCQGFKTVASVSVIPSEQQQTIKAKDKGGDGIETVIVDPIPNSYMREPTESLTIDLDTLSGDTVDVLNYKEVTITGSRGEITIPEWDGSYTLAEI